MAATLYSIDAALFTALSVLLTDQTTGPTAAKPFACVGRHAGPVTRESLAHVAAAFPCALLRRDDETSANIVRTFGGYVEDKATATWSVIVALEDPRDIDAGTHGSGPASTVRGLDDLCDAAIGALNGLAVTGLFAEQPVRYRGTRHELTELGVVYADAVTFEAWRVVPQVTNTDPGAALPEVQPIVGAVDLEGTGAGAPDPFLTFQSDPNP